MTESTQVPKGKGGGGGYSGIQVTGMIAGLFWGGNFRFRDIFGRKMLATICFGSLI